MRLVVNDTYRKDKVLVDITFTNVGIEIRRLDKAKEELVNNLQMRPGKLQHRLVFFGVERVASRIDLRWDRSEQIRGKLSHQSMPYGDVFTVCASPLGGLCTYHLDHFGVYRLGNHASVLCDVFQHFVQGLRLDLLAFEVGTGVVEVEDNATLLQLLNE